VRWKEAVVQVQPYDFFFLTPPSRMSEDDDLLRDEGSGEERWAVVGIMVVDEDGVEGNDSVGMEYPAGREIERVIPSGCTRSDGEGGFIAAIAGFFSHAAFTNSGQDHSAGY
jgi:hypothetical protein